MGKLFYRIFTIIFLAVQLPPSTLAISGRITSGRDVVQISEAPFMVSIQREMNGFRQHICGGVIISANHILSVASCFTRNFYSTLRIRAGVINHDDPLTVGQTINVQIVFIHPDFNPLNQDTRVAQPNIAVLLLFSPLTLQPGSVETRTLPALGTNPADNSVGTLTGWGSTSNALRPHLSRRLQRADVTIALNCAPINNTLPALHNNVFCSVRGTTYTSGCTGDLGSPLLSGNNLIGIVSQYYLPCGYSPTLYTRVNTFTPWINNVMNPAVPRKD